MFRLLAFSALLLASSTSLAYCWSTSAGSACLDDMPLYDQKSPSIPASWFEDGVAAESQLCAPTAGSMAMQGLLNNLADQKVQSDGWLSSNISGLPMAQQIVQTAIMMSTDPIKGTFGPGFHNFAARANEYVVPIPGTALKYPVARYYNNQGGKITLDAFSAIFNAGVTGMVTSYGHYTQNKKVVFTPNHKQTTITYARNGGHVVAPRGYIADVVVFNDPEGGVIQFSQLEPMTSFTINHSSASFTVTTQQILPNSQAQSVAYKVFQAGTYYPIVEDMQAIVASYQN